MMVNPKARNTYRAEEIASFFLNKESMTPKKLQKLTYYAEAWHQALRDRSLIIDESFEAWVHGPVAPGLYQKYKKFGWTPIPRHKNIDVDFDDETLEVLESVWETYGDQDGNSLEALTHSELPWIKARTNLEPNENSNVKINEDDMKSYYRSIYLGG